MVSNGRVREGEYGRRGVKVDVRGETGSPDWTQSMKERAREEGTSG